MARQQTEMIFSATVLVAARGGSEFSVFENGCCPLLVVGESIGFGPETDRAKAMARKLRDSDCTRVVHFLPVCVW